MATSRTAPSTPPDPASVVLAFLESIGRRSETEFYLKLFRGLPRESFALIAASQAAQEEALGSLVQDLRFLHQLGLSAPVVLGALDAVDDAKAAAQRVLGALGFAQLPCESLILDANADVEQVAAQMRAHIASERVVVVALASSDAEQRFERLGQLAKQLETRKLVVLHPRGGLGPRSAGGVLLPGSRFRLPTHESGISVINLRTDGPDLLSSTLLEANERELLEQLRGILDLNPTLRAASVTSPLNLLQELFTVRGAGTLVKRGSPIQRYASYDELDAEALRRLLAATFGNEIQPAFFERQPLAIYLEQAYRGAAIVEPGKGAAFLTKFAVNRQAQGEGIGRDLWTAMLRDHERIYWRARPNNPIASWYASNCDGMAKTEAYTVYWRGLAPNDLPDAIRDALARPGDFSS